MQLHARRMAGGLNLITSPPNSQQSRVGNVNSCSEVNVRAARAYLPSRFPPTMPARAASQASALRH